MSATSICTSGGEGQSRMAYVEQPSGRSPDAQHGCPQAGQRPLVGGVRPQGARQLRPRPTPAQGQQRDKALLSSSQLHQSLGGSQVPAAEQGETKGVTVGLSLSPQHDRDPLRTPHDQDT